MPRTKKRTFVLDTNVLVHDPNAIFSFDEHDVVIPITVVEELDGLKNGYELRNWSARAASNKLWNCIKVDQNAKCHSLGKNKGKLYLPLFNGYDAIRDRFTFLEDKADYRIISSAYESMKQGKNVTLVTKDLDVRIIASQLGIRVEDYLQDAVKDPDFLTAEMREIMPDELEEKSLKDELYLNQPVILRAGGSEYLYRWNGKEYARVTRRRINTGEKLPVKAQNIDQDFAVNVLMDPSISIVALNGAAGSGKTLLAVACSIAQRRLYDKILIARPAIELSDKSIGFLPGDLFDKYDPYFGPVRSAVRFILEGESNNMTKDGIEKWMNEKSMEKLALSMVRGETFHKSFIIVDEAQNLTPTEIKTIVSRAGKNTKVVITGDIGQIDVKYLTKESNGLAHLADRFRGQSCFAYSHLKHSVRSPLAELADKLL